MTSVWRICKGAHRRDLFSGDGGLRISGRWHRPGVRIVHTSETKALAAREFFVRLSPDIAPPLVIAEAVIPEEVSIEEITAGKLPRGRDETPAPAELQEVGMQWLRQGSTAVLRVPSCVPSAVIRDEWNHPLNPLHAEFKRIKLGKPVPFRFDQRVTG